MDAGLPSKKRTLLTVIISSKRKKKKPNKQTQTQTQEQWSQGNGTQNFHLKHPNTVYGKSIRVIKRGKLKDPIIAKEDSVFSCISQVINQTFLTTVIWHASETKTMPEMCAWSTDSAVADTNLEAGIFSAHYLRFS